MGLMWAPLIHLQPEIGGFASTGEAADWASKSPAGLRVIRYLREVVEMLTRLLVEDPRVTYLTKDDVRVLAAFSADGPDELFKSRAALNEQIARFGLDDWMAPDRERGSSDSDISPISLVRFGPMLTAIKSSWDLVIWAEEHLLPGTLGDLRELLELSISIKCGDPRKAFLSGIDRTALVALTSETPTQLLDSLRRVNGRLAALKADQRVNVTSIVAPLMPLPGVEPDVDLM